MAVPRVSFAKRRGRKRTREDGAQVGDAQDGRRSFCDRLMPPGEARHERTLRLCFYGVALALLVLMGSMSFGAGMSGDDTINYEHAKAVYDYYADGDKAAVETEGPSLMAYFGQSFDNFTYLVNRWLGIENEYESRHFMNAVVGWFVVLVVGLFLVKMFGWRAGILGMIFMFLSPRFLGHSFNNPKDIPFALGYVLAIFQMFLLCRELPVIKWHRLIWLALSIALAISVRVGGLMLIPYLFLFVGFWFLQNAPIRRIATWAYWKEALKLIAILAVVSLVGYMAGLVWWPYALQAPFSHPFEAMELMSRFTVAMRQIFEGKVYVSNDLPPYYLVKYIAISTPVVILLGTLLFFAFFRQTVKKTGWIGVLILLFSFAFPILYIMWQGSNVYGGWRHVLFTYPFLAMISAAGFEGITARFPRRAVRITVCALITLMLVPPLCHTVRNHPYEYVYFNALIGGTSKAYGQYEMDYYYHSSREAAEWVIRNAEKPADGSKIKVAVNHQSAAEYYFRRHMTDFEISFVKWYERGDSDWDYAIFTLTGISAELLRGPHFPPANTVHTVDVDGRPIAVILRRGDKSDLYGSRFRAAGELDSALVCYRKALEADPYNDVAIANVADIYIRKAQPDSALNYLRRFLAIDPNRARQKYQAAYLYYEQAEYERSLNALDEMIEYNTKYEDAYHLKAQIYLANRDIDAAEEVYNRMMDQDILSQIGFDNLLWIYKSQGLDDQAAQKKLFTRLSESYRKQGLKEKAKKYKGYADEL